MEPEMNGCVGAAASEAELAEMMALLGVPYLG